MVMKRRLYSSLFDVSVNGALTITEASAGATSRSVSGAVTVYHNLLRVVGTSVLSNITHSDTCCLPVSGTVTTVFSAGTNVGPTLLGTLLVGKAEVLTITGCGTGTLQRIDGSSVHVALNGCI